MKKEKKKEKKEQHLLQKKETKICLQITSKNISIKCDFRRTDKDKSMCSSRYFSLNVENTHYSEFMKGLVLSVLFIHTFMVHFRHIARF